MRQVSMSRIQGFGRDKRGNVALLFGIAIIPILLGVGVAVDYGRALIVRERMSAALDAAALAIGSWQGLSQDELKVKAQQYFNANYAASAIGTANNIDVQFSGNDIIVRVAGVVPTTFMRLANYDKLDVSATSVITKKERNLELALVLDTTGSMSSSLGSGKKTKIEALKDAAKSMVNTLFDGKSTSDTLKVAVVPFAAAVRLNKDDVDMAWIDTKAKSAVAKEDFGSSVVPYDLFSKMKSQSWSGCVRERNGSSYELTDAAPGSTSDSLWAPYFAPDEPGDKGSANKGYTNSYIDDTETCTGSGKNKTCSTGTDQQIMTDTAKYTNASVSSGSSGPAYNCAASPLIRLNNTKSTVTTAIGNLAANGNTVLPAGLLWGWRVLSPTAPFTDGGAYDDEKLIKALVLLTDGDNDVGQTSSGINKSAYNAFGYAAKGHLGSTGGTQANSTLDTKALTVCSAVKDKGIRVYTIGLGVSTNSQKLLKDCASTDEQGNKLFYNSPSTDQLASIFQDIAQGLSELRIAQ